MIPPLQPNKPQPTFTNKRILQRVVQTSYGKRIHGGSRGYDYDVYVDGDDKNIFFKLYYISKDNKFIKSVLRYFSGNKVAKEVRSVNWL